jgi:glycosyltransferase involved in cell wall biosynthesis
MYKVAFVMEQTLGNTAHSMNIHKNLHLIKDIEPFWIPVNFDADGLMTYFPLFNNWSVRSGLYARKRLNGLSKKEHTDNLFNNWSVRSSLYARKKLKELSKKERIDGLFMHTHVVARNSLHFLKKYPSIVSLDATPVQIDLLGLYDGHKIDNNFVEWLKKKMTQRVFNSASNLVAWSERTKKSLVDDYSVDKNKVTVIPPGVNMEKFDFAKPKNKSKKEINLLFVGAEFERKGGSFLLESFRQLRKECKASLNLHLITKSKLEKEEGVFVYPDISINDSRLFQLYGKADIFVLPALGDCMPVALMEASAAGLPIVSTDIAAIPEIVEEGKSGMLVKPGDSEALTNALKKLIDSPALRRKMGVCARNIALERFDAKKNTVSLVELIKKVIKESS